MKACKDDYGDDLDTMNHSDFDGEQFRVQWALTLMQC